MLPYIYILHIHNIIHICLYAYILRLFVSQHILLLWLQIKLEGALLSWSYLNRTIKSAQNREVNLGGKGQISKKKWKRQKYYPKIILHTKLYPDWTMEKCSKSGDKVRGEGVILGKTCNLHIYHPKIILHTKCYLCWKDFDIML